MEEPIPAPTRLEKLPGALVAFQADVPVVEKKRTANVGKYSYKFADLADVWAAVRPVLAKHKLAVTQILSGGRDGFTELETTIWHESGESLPSIIDIPTGNKTAQECGSLFTYYKRYALGAALGVATEEDDDGAAGNKPPAPAQATPKASGQRVASDKQIQLIKSLAKRLGYDEAWFANTIVRINSSADASAVIDKLQGLVEDKEATSENTSDSTPA